MPRLKTAIGVAAVAFVSLGSSYATAQDSDADAERLFREGQRLLEERRFGEACPKFEQAYRKDRQLGTLINLAFCHKEQGAIWYAWLEFKEAEVRATELNRPDRREFARQRLLELEKQLPKVVIDNPRKMPLTEVLVEEKKVPEAERGAVFAAEEGRRKFTFRAKGKKQATVMVTVARGERAQHVVAPEMEDASGDDLPPAASAPLDPPRKVDSGSEAPAGDGTQRTLGWTAIAVGGVAGAVGAVTGIMTFTNGCANTQEPPQCTDAVRSSGDTTGAISTVSFIVAGVAIASGIVLLVTAPPASTASSAKRSPRLGFGVTGLSGTF
ncbi:MAG: hypothetical protein KF819_31895 [Labilithrix sp.]|nr:hypothetical protein [Labilithrix sp.]